MTNLAELRKECDALHSAFISACLDAGYSDEWSAYKADDVDPSAWPSALTHAHDAYIAKLYAFYALRDGPGGVLGSRGL